ncbi:unnamed protein product [Leptosia nina]|uniref:Carbonyl reductase n=1 Tax=Leptosia nina TaxID=320188 RepID=A0AAV1IZP0_9NEOP
MAGKIAVVTGSNKGIGYAIVKELCKRGVSVVYLTARDIQRGQKAVEELKKEGYSPSFYQLEVNNEDNVKSFAKHLKKTHGGLDILINNAGVIVKDFRETTYEDSVHVLDINYKAILTIEKYIYPLLKNNARVINVSSDCGHISNINNKYWIERLTKDDLGQEDVDDFVEWFLDSVKNGTINYNDFAENTLVAYRVSKVALCALSKVQQKQIGRNISINSLHPGFVKTSMTKGAGYLTMDEAAQTPAYLALDVDQTVKGKYFWFDKTEKDWQNYDLKLYPKLAMIENELKSM